MTWSARRRPVCVIFCNLRLPGELQPSRLATDRLLTSGSPAMLLLMASLHVHQRIPSLCLWSTYHRKSDNKFGAESSVLHLSKIPKIRVKPAVPAAFLPALHSTRIRMIVSTIIATGKESTLVNPSYKSQKLSGYESFDVMRSVLISRR